MTSVCAIADCLNTGRTKGKVEGGSSLMFHRFPKDLEVSKCWIVKCKRNTPVNVKSARVCSDHFLSSDYERDLQNELLGLPVKKRLKPDAVPSIFKFRPNTTAKKCNADRELRVETRNRKQLVEEILASHSKGQNQNTCVVVFRGFKSRKVCSPKADPPAAASLPLTSTEPIILEDEDETEIQTMESFVEFNPILWFVCRLCRETFSNTDELNMHKVETHLAECTKIKCIIFEERFVNHDGKELTRYHGVGSTQSARTQNSFTITNPAPAPPEPGNMQDISVSTVVSDKRVLPNPRISITRLTPNQFNTYSSSTNKSIIVPGCDKNENTNDSIDIDIDHQNFIKPEDSVSEFMDCSDGDDDFVPARNPATEVGTASPNSDGSDDAFSPSPVISEVDPLDSNVLVPHKIETEKSHRQLEFILQPSPEIKDLLGKQRIDIPAVRGENMRVRNTAKPKKVSSASLKVKPAQVKNQLEEVYLETELELEPSLSLKEWLVLQKRKQEAMLDSANKFRHENQILLDPDLFSVDCVEINDGNPVTCKLCRSKLVSEAEVRNHAENCWLHNKPSHVFCPSCEVTFPTRVRLLQHNKRQHLQIPAEELDDEQTEALPLIPWLVKQKERPNNLILLEPDPSESAEESNGTGTGTTISETTPIKCKLCQQLLTSEPLLRNHVKTCWRFSNSERKRRYCLPCKKPFYPISRKVHNRWYHSVPDPNASLNCKTCLRNFPSLFAFNTHQQSLQEFFKNKHGAKAQQKNQEKEEIRTSDGDKQNERKPGGMRSLSQLSNWLKFERTVRSVGGFEKVIRIQPDPTSLSQSELDAYTLNQHNPITCLLCSKKLSTYVQVQNHLVVCSIRNKQNHRYCVPCEKDFGAVKQLEDHKKTMHPDELKASFRCTLCAKTFVDEGLFANHEKSHTDPNFRAQFSPFKCPHCPAVRRFRNTLMRHLIQHGRETVFKCKYCGKSVATREKLIEHEITHGGGRPFECKVSNCVASFRNAVALRVHKRMKHGQELGLSQLLCPECGRTFGMECLLKQHILVEHIGTGNKPFKCTHEGCTATFKSKQNLNKHSSVHNEGSSFQCEECGKTFTQRKSLNYHKRSHGKKT